MTVGGRLQREPIPLTYHSRRTCGLLGHGYVGLDLQAAVPVTNARTNVMAVPGNDDEAPLARSRSHRVLPLIIPGPRRILLPFAVRATQAPQA